MRAIVLLLITLARLLVSTSVIAGGGQHNHFRGCLSGFCNKLDFGRQLLDRRPSEVRQHAGKNNYQKLTMSHDEGNTIAHILANKKRMAAIDEATRRDGAKVDRLASLRDPKYELTAKCFRQYGPIFTKMPAVHVFAHESHSPLTSGCGQNTEFELKPTNGHLSLNPELNSGQIKKLLIDSNVFNASVETYFITHGYMSAWDNSGWMCEMKDLILDKSDVNVVLVDWSGGSVQSNPLDYVKSVSNTIFVGALLGELIRSLVELSGQPDASSYHMIGHSLGAHISGFAGYYLDGTVGHITGLDPAGPCFTASSKLATVAVEDGYLDDGSRRLSRKSAQSVLVLHTDSSLFGLKQNCGHYDVYVNGGYKQPDCDTTSDYDLNIAGGRQSPSNMGSFINIDKFIKHKLPCRHTYAYKMLNQVSSVLDRKQPNGERLTLDNNMNRCYSVAYQCRSWRAFKAGECGFCRDEGHRCIFIGIKSFVRSATRVLDKKSRIGRSESMAAPQVPDSIIEANQANDDQVNQTDDDHFNDEDEERNEKMPENLSEERSVAEYSQGKHFMKTGRSPMTCMYNYQIVIAVKRRAKQSAKRFFYLHVPLEQSGRLNDKTGKRLNDRLVQVSHKVNRESAAYTYLRTTYVNSVGNKKSFAKSEELDFYTALITFEPITEASKCGKDDPTNGAGREDKWQICNPLDNIQEARLWSSTDANLDAVAWVGMNYMSGLDYEHRLRESYVFRRISPELVKARDQIQKSYQAQFNGKASVKERRTFSDRVTSAMKKLDCLLSLLDTRTNRDARRKFKCDRSRQELFYAIKLKPFRLGNK